MKGVTGQGSWVTVLWRPERASIMLKVTQSDPAPRQGSGPSAAPTPYLAASWLWAHKLSQAPGTQRQREVTIKAYQTAGRRQPQISEAK